MPPLRRLSTTLWLVLLLVVSLVSGLPYRNGSANLGGDAQYSRLNLAIPPCITGIPSRPANDASPFVFYSPLSSILSSAPPSCLSFFNFGSSELTSRVALTRQTISYILCEAKPPLIYSRAAFVAYRALFRARVKYCTSYHRALRRPAPISSPVPAPVSAPPASTRVKGPDIPPTRARTTSASNPAEALPAHGWIRGRSCTYKYDTTPTPSPTFAKLQVDEDQDISSVVPPAPKSLYRTISAPLRRGNIIFYLCLYRASIWLGIPHVWFERVVALLACLIAIPFLIKNILADIALRNQPLEPASKRVIHYAYELIVQGHRFQMKILRYQKRWEDSGMYGDRTKMERSTWFDIERTLRQFEKKYADEPLLGIGLSLKRKKTVFDIYEDQNGTYTIEVPQDNNGVEIFASDNHFKFDPDPTSAHLEELDDAAPSRAVWVGLGFRYQASGRLGEGTGMEEAFSGLEIGRGDMGMTRVGIEQAVRAAGPPTPTRLEW